MVGDGTGIALWNLHGGSRLGRQGRRPRFAALEARCGTEWLGWIAVPVHALSVAGLTCQRARCSQGRGSGSRGRDFQITRWPDRAHAGECIGVGSERVVLKDAGHVCLRRGMSLRHSQPPMHLTLRPSGSNKSNEFSCRNARSLRAGVAGTIRDPRDTDRSRSAAQAARAAAVGGRVFSRTRARGARARSQ